MSRMRLKKALLDALQQNGGLPGAPFYRGPGVRCGSGGSSRQRARPGTQDEEDKAKDDDTLKSEYRAIAERRVRLGLLLAEIGRINSITVSEQEVDRALYQRAMRISVAKRCRCWSSCGNTRNSPTTSAAHY